MSTFTVLAAQQKSEKPDKGYGPMQEIALTLRDHMDQTQIAEWYTKATTPLPAEGSTLDGELTPSQYGLKFKKASTGQGGGGSTYRPRDPKETAAIQRQHSQSVAVEYIKAKANAGAIGPASNFPDTEQLRALIDWFQRDIEHGVALAQQQSAYGTSQRKDIEHVGGSDVPADGVPQQQAQLADTADVPF